MAEVLEDFWDLFNNRLGSTTHENLKSESQRFNTKTFEQSNKNFTEL